MHGFTAFIPWYYIPFKTPLRGKESTGLEYLRVLAISRLYLDNVPHLQASWLTPGLKMGQLALFYGCDDMGGTIIEEQVVHDAGEHERSLAPRPRGSDSRRRLHAGHPRYVLEHPLRLRARNGVEKPTPAESSG